MSASDTERGLIYDMQMKQLEALKSLNEKAADLLGIASTLAERKPVVDINIDGVTRRFV
jgi:hypothetical protein